MWKDGGKRRAVTPAGATLAWILYDAQHVLARLISELASSCVLVAIIFHAREPVLSSHHHCCVSFARSQEILPCSEVHSQASKWRQHCS